MTAAARAGARRDLVERLGRLRDERRPQQQIFGRVPGDRELGEDDEVATRGLGLVVRLEDPRRVALEIADDDVDLGGGHPEARHGPRIREAERRRSRDTRLARDPVGGRRLPTPLRRARGERRRRPRRGDVRRCGRSPVGARRRVRDRARRDRARARAGVEVVGVDVDPSMLATARAQRSRDRVARARPRRRSISAGCSTSCCSPATSRSSPRPGPTARLVAGCARHVGAGRRPRRRLPTRAGLRARRVRRRLPRRRAWPSSSGSRPGPGTRSGPATATPCRFTTSQIDLIAGLP